MFASVKRVTDVAKPVINAQSQSGALNINQQKLDIAKKMAARINIAKNLGPDAQDITQQAAAAIISGGLGGPQVKVSG